MRSVIGRYPDDCTLMGYAVRNEKYRYVAWISGDFEDRSDFNNDEIVMEELYDYEIVHLKRKVMLLMLVTKKLRRR